MKIVLEVLAVVVVLAIIAGAVWWVRRKRPESKPPMPSLLGGEGWQFYSRPTELEPPGTVFRIDGEKRRYMVDTLEVPTQSGAEAVGRREESVQASMGMVARFFGLGPKLDVKSRHNEDFVFELGGASRQFVEDADLDSVLESWLEQHSLRDGSRYYVIREAVSGREITYHLNQGQVDSLGGEAALTDAAKLEGNLHTSKSKADFLLQQKFAKPMRVFFLPEQLRPLTRGLAESTVVGRRPVTEPLEWEDAEGPG